MNVKASTFNAEMTSQKPNRLHTLPSSYGLQNTLGHVACKLSCPEGGAVLKVILLGTNRLALLTRVSRLNGLVYGATSKVRSRGGVHVPVAEAFIPKRLTTETGLKGQRCRRRWQR